MNIVFLAETDPGAQFYMLSKEINKQSNHKSRCITLATNYLNYPTDFWLGYRLVNGKTKPILPKNDMNERLEEAKHIIDIGNFYVFLRGYWTLPGHKIILSRKNHIIKTAGTDARNAPGRYLDLSLQKKIMHVSSPDYSQARNCGFSAMHIPICIDFDMIPEFKGYDFSKIRLSHASTDFEKKYTQQLIEIAKQEKIDLKLIVRATWRKSLRLKSLCNVNFDQIYLGSFGMSSVESWAMHQPSLVYFDGWTKSIFPDFPGIQVTKDTLADTLRAIAHGMYQLNIIGEQSYEYVKQHHDVQVVAKQWLSLIDFVKYEMN